MESMLSFKRIIVDFVWNKVVQIVYLQIIVQY